MPAIEIGFVATAAALALASLGGGLYEFLVIDPFWPRRPDLSGVDRPGALIASGRSPAKGLGRARSPSSGAGLFVARMPPSANAPT